MTDSARLDQLCINTLRMLSIDAVQKGKSGYPGTPLSAGHASALLYRLLNRCRVKATGTSCEQPGRLAVTLDDIKTVRQPGNGFTGHPGYGWTTGAETTCRLGCAGFGRQHRSPGETCPDRHGQQTGRA